MLAISCTFVEFVLEEIIIMPMKGMPLIHSNRHEWK
jgi:hypothetical protein